MLRGLCDVAGGTFYALSGSMICPSYILPYTWNTTQIPFCATNCNIYDLIDAGYFAYEGCTNNVNDVVTFDPIIDDTCMAEMTSFSYEAGYGDPQWVLEHYYSQGECFDNFETFIIYIQLEHLNFKNLIIFNLCYRFFYS